MILIVTALFPPEPVVSANMSCDIADELSKNNDVIVLSPKPSRPLGTIFYEKSYNLNYKFKHILLNSYVNPKSNVIGRFIESFSFGISTKKYIELHHQNIEVIYANTWPLFAQLYLSKVAFKYKIPLVLHVQDIYPESFTKKVPFLGGLLNRILLPLDKKILKYSTFVVTISYKMKNYLIHTRDINEDKIVVIRNWQNDENFIKYNNKLQKSEKFIFMYVGSISPSACVDFLIHSFGKANLKNAKLIIAGNGSDKEKCIKIAKLYVDKDIEFKEVLSTDVADIQSKANVLIFSLKKGIAKTALPSKLTAYMFSGKPIVASIDLDSEPANIIRDNCSGFIVEPENENELICCMEEIINKKEDELIEIGKNSFNYAENNLSKKNNLSKIIKIIYNTRKEINC